MAKKSKRTKEIVKIVDKDKVYTAKDAIELLKACPKVKFDQSVEFALDVNVDPKKHQIRGTSILPHGTGKKQVVVVLTKGNKEAEAKDAGADFVGAEDIVEKIKGGWTDFTVLIASPDMMREVGKLGKILGPRNLMPSPKAGTVTAEIGKAVEEVKKGKIEFKLDKTAVINTIIGKLGFETDKLVDNLRNLVQAITSNKPAGAKGVFLKSLSLSSTMGPGLKIDLQSVNVGQG